MKSFTPAQLPLGVYVVFALITVGLRLEAHESTTAEVQPVVDALRARLGIDAAVKARIVPSNDLLVSVERANDRGDAFVLSFEAAFLATLDEADLRAVIAHELGHVWIFTHHPYLQTERQANDIAMRVVSRDSLQRVYAKVWGRGGLKGNLERFLGLEP